MTAPRLISADSHVAEPGNLWQERLDRKFRERGPRIVTDDKGGSGLMADGFEGPHQVSFIFNTNSSGTSVDEGFRKDYNSCLPRGGWDPLERIKAQEVDGVAAEVLYTSLGMPLFRLPDPELQAACFRVYNDWLAEFISHDPSRLIAIGLIPLGDISEGVKELERCAKLGLRGAQIPAGMPDERPYHSPIFDPLWAAADRLNMPLSLHLGTGLQLQFRPTTEGLVLRAMTLVHEIELTLSSIVAGGAFERFPGLKIVSAENDAGWMPYLMYKLDRNFLKYHTVAWHANLSMKPSEYFRRHVYATFLEDPIAPLTHQYFGEDNFMWGSDYPHQAATWPNSVKIVDDLFTEFPPLVKRKITHDNAAKLYHIDF